MNSTIIKQMEQARKIIKVITGNNYRVQKLEKDTRKVVRSINPEIEEKFDKLNVLPYGYTLTFPFLNIFVITNNEEEYQMDMSDAENGIVLSYVYNLSNPELSEFGSVQVDKKFNRIFQEKISMNEELTKVLQKLEKDRVEFINYDYYKKKGEELVLDSFEYVKEFDYLYLKIVVKLYRVIGVDEYDDNNSFNTFSRIGRKWYANWINPDGLSIKIDDILNYKVDSQYIRLLKE